MLLFVELLFEVRSKEFHIVSLAILFLLLNLLLHFLIYLSLNSNPSFIINSIFLFSKTQLLTLTFEFLVAPCNFHEFTQGFFKQAQPRGKALPEHFLSFQ